MWQVNFGSVSNSGKFDLTLFMQNKKPPNDWAAFAILVTTGTVVGIIGLEPEV